MDTEKHGCEAALLFQDETRQVIGCAMTVLNTLGYGFLEKVYENSLAVELKRQGVPFLQQPRYEVSYKGSAVGDYVPDFIAFNNIIVELKAIEALTPREQSQMLNYLKVTGLKVGLILNFSKPKLEWKRTVL